MCPTCEHEAGRVDGATAIPGYAFSVAEIARALVLVGQGVSMREASQQVRFEADRYRVDPSGRRTASRQNALSADYLDQYAQVVIRRFTPTRWPRILTLDSQPLDVRAYGADALGYRPERRGGAVLVAAGKDEPRQSARTWHVGLAGDDSARRAGHPRPGTSSTRGAVAALSLAGPITMASSCRGRGC